jgi:uncharacterized protein
MPRRWLKRVLPDIEKYRGTAVERLLGPRFFHPALWHLSRRSVAGAFAIGLLCGMIPGPFQMPAAAVCAVWRKRNLPVALVTTLYTNPLTIIPLYVLAYYLGAFVTGAQVVDVTPPLLTGVSPAQWAELISQWALSLGKPLLIGIPLLGVLLAVTGYVSVLTIWGIYLRWAWTRRRLGART